MFLLVETTTCGYRAASPDHPDVPPCCGDTPEEAIGRLIVSHPHTLGISLSIHYHSEHHTPECGCGRGDSLVRELAEAATYHRVNPDVPAPSDYHSSGDC